MQMHVTIWAFLHASKHGFPEVIPANAWLLS